jgi:acetyltransferase-like isoleucine patch superfamily enzyme
MISETSEIHPNVKLGDNCIVEDFAIIEAPPRGFQSGELSTVIGNNAHIRSHTVIYAGNSIGNNFHTGNKVNLRELNKIGNNISIGALSVVEHHVIIGSGLRIHTQTFIPEYTILEDESWIGPGVVFTNARYPNSPNAKKELKGCHVEMHSIIGANGTILPGVRLGKWVIVGAGFVMTKDVQAHSVVAVNPAKIINTIDKLPYNVPISL